MRAATETLVVLALCGCMGEASSDAPVSLSKVTPRKVSARGGSVMKLEGWNFTPSTTIEVGGQPAKVKLISSTQLEVTAPALMAGRTELVATAGGGSKTELYGGVEVMAMELAFVEAAPYALPLEPAVVVNSAAARDFDGDGDVDLFTCATGLPCRLLENDGRGNFAAPLAAVDGGSDAGSVDAGRIADAGAASVDAGPKSELEPLLAGPVLGRMLGSGDLDGDGDPDLLVALPDGGSAVATNDGAGAFITHPLVFTVKVQDAGASDGGAPPPPPPAAPLSAAVLDDIDGDGDLDLLSAGATPSAGPFRIELNDSVRDVPAFRSRPVGLEPRAWSVTAIAAGDLDRDGARDLVLATTGGADGISLRVFLSRGPTFTELPGGLPGVGPYSAIAVGDVDGDGADDVVATGAGQDRLLLNDGSGHFFDASALELPLDGSRGTSLVLADLDRDRDLDMLVGNAAATMRLYVNDGKGRFLDRTPTLPRRMETVLWLDVANFDRDADLDILVLTDQAAAARLYLSVEP